MSCVASVTQFPQLHSAIISFLETATGLVKGMCVKTRWPAGYRDRTVATVIHPVRWGTRGKRAAHPDDRTVCTCVSLSSALHPPSFSGVFSVVHPGSGPPLCLFKCSGGTLLNHEARQ